MTTESYKKLKKSPEYKAYLSLGLTDISTGKQIKNGKIEFKDDISECHYVFYSKTGWVRRYKESDNKWSWEDSKVISYPLNPKKKFGPYFESQIFPGDIKKLFTLGLPSAIRYKRQKTTAIVIKYNEQVAEAFI